MEKPSELSIELPDEASTVDLGRQLGGALPRSGIVFLSGELGAGKTTLVRGVLHSLGHVGAVKSPTYTLCEPYIVSGDFSICHFDLYRLGQAEELEFLGFRDYVSSGALLLIEWPERAAGWLPVPDLEIRLSHRDSGRSCDLIGHGERGQTCLMELAA